MFLLIRHFFLTVTKKFYIIKPVYSFQANIFQKQENQREMGHLWSAVRDNQDGRLNKNNLSRSAVSAALWRHGEAGYAFNLGTEMRYEREEKNKENSRL